LKNFAPRASVLERLLLAARRLRDATNRLHFSPPVTHVYNPLAYAWAPHELYLRRFATNPKRVVFLGMNPGPFGMAQTGVPFGEIAAVRDWLCLEAAVNPPRKQHPKRPVSGFACPRSEVSGQRLWGLFAKRFGTSRAFFHDHIVLNYCPLAFLESTGRNRTPDKLRPSEQATLFAACDAHLRLAIAALEPQWLIGIGEFAFRRARNVFPDGQPKLGHILHPSPASPAANRDWAGRAAQQLEAVGVWSAAK
jgi:single-strand selective monofunctional uracil DNA glycosylase